MLWLLLLCFSLLRLLVLLRGRDISQKLRELLSLHGTQERSQVGKDARKPVCIREVWSVLWSASVVVAGLLGSPHSVFLASGTFSVSGFFSAGFVSLSSAGTH